MGIFPGFSPTLLTRSQPGLESSMPAEAQTAFQILTTEHSILRCKQFLDALSRFNLAEATQGRQWRSTRV